MLSLQVRPEGVGVGVGVNVELAVALADELADEVAETLGVEVVVGVALAIALEEGRVSTPLPQPPTKKIKIQKPKTKQNDINST